jgi:hypothetical protein
LIFIFSISASTLSNRQSIFSMFFSMISNLKLVISSFSFTILSLWLLTEIKAQNHKHCIHKVFRVYLSNESKPNKCKRHSEQYESGCGSKYLHKLTIRKLRGN